MKKRKDSTRKAIILLCLLLVLLALLLGYFAFWPVAISGTVFDDRNGDRIRQQQEVGLAARVVRLLNAAGKEVKQTKSKRDGGYRFDGLGVDKYTVVVVLDSPSADTPTERKVTITQRREMTNVDVGVPPGKPKDQTEGRRNRKVWLVENGGDKDTERAVDLALAWLAEHQCGDGGWFFDLARQECRNCRGKCSTSEAPRFDRTAATALALLPFLGRGISHRNSTPDDARYQKTVAKGIAFLQDRVAADGKVDGVGEHWSMYSQGLAGIVLAELCEIVASDQQNADANKPIPPDNQNDKPIDEKALSDEAKRVLRFICRAQDLEGGGWRYAPRQPGDISVVGWQMMALHAGKKALKAPGTWEDAVGFLDSVQADDGATYGYQNNSDPIPRRSAIGLLCRMYADWPENHPPLVDGVSRIATVGPTQDLYFDYYATQVMFHMGGEQWRDWNIKMKQLLLATQRKPEHGHEVGSWFEGVQSDPSLDTPGGRLYCTSLAAMILEVYHRHLRIYRPHD